MVHHQERNNEQATFHRFPHLPAEIRIAIWEHHFAQPRVHVLSRRSGPSSRRSFSDDAGSHGDNEDVPLFTNTTRCVDPDSCVNYEASFVATSVRRRRRVPVFFARDLTASATAAQRGTTRGTPPLESLLNAPVFIDWATDLVCAGPGFADDGGGGCAGALDRLRGHAWTGWIHRLGLHVGPRDLAQLLAVAAPCSLDDDNGGVPLIAELPDLLADFASLEELRLLVGLPGAARSAWAARRPRDAFGFVPFDILAETRSRAGTGTGTGEEIKPWGSEDADLSVGGIGLGFGSDAPPAFPSLAMRTLFPELEVLLRDFVGTRNRPVKLITAVDLNYAA